MAVELQHLHYHLLDGQPGWGCVCVCVCGGGGVNYVFVPPPNLDPHLFDKIRVRHEEGFNGRSCCHRPVLTVPMEACFDPEAKALHGSLHPAPSSCDSLVDEAPDIWQDPHRADKFPPWWLGYGPAEFSEQPGGQRGKRHLLPSYRACYRTSAPRDIRARGMIRVVARIPDQHFMVWTAVRPQEVVGPGVHHLVSVPHASCVPIPQTRFSSREEMGTHFFQTRGHQCLRDLLCARCPLWVSQVRIEVAIHQYLSPLGPPVDGREDVLYDQGVASATLPAKGIWVSTLLLGIDLFTLV